MVALLEWGPQGRYWVAVSLAEAETLRRALHVKADAPLLARAKGKPPKIALRYAPLAAPGAPAAGDGGVLLDASRGWWRAALAADAHGDAHAAGVPRRRRTGKSRLRHSTPEALGTEQRHVCGIQEPCKGGV